MVGRSAKNGGTLATPRTTATRRRRFAAAATVLLSVLALLSTPAQAADLTLTNNGFENDLTGWTQFGNGGNTVSTAQAYKSTKSALIDDNDDNGGTGLESSKVAATAGVRYTAYARFYVEKGTPDLYLRFYDSSDGYISGASIPFVGKLNEWTLVRLNATAPTGTARLTVLPYSSKGNNGVAYVDDVLVTPRLTDLGAQVTAAQINGSTFGTGANQNKVYGVFAGSSDKASNPARMAVIDVDQERAGSSFALPNADGAWAATTATDGRVYLGTYQNGGLYQYVPGATSVNDLGAAIDGETFVWDLTPGLDGVVYGGTYGNAGYFKYDPKSSLGPVQIGSKPIWPGKQYVRSLAFDPVQTQTYLGTGTNATLVRFDRETGAKAAIPLPSEYSNETVIGGLTYTGDRLFTVLGSGKLSVLRIYEDASGAPQAEQEATLPKSALTVSPAHNGRVYAVNGNQLYEYDLAAHTFTALPVTTDPTLVVSSFGWVHLTDQGAFPNDTLVVVGHGKDGETYLLKYNPESKASRLAQVANTPHQPVDISAVGVGSDGGIYTGGFVTGGTGRYEPFRGDTDDRAAEQLTWGLTQIESVLPVNGKTYFGTYPGALVSEYDPTQPWVRGSNPRQIMNLGGELQDRPYTMATGGGKLFVGTTPKNGYWDGALSVYDLTTGAYTAYRGFVPNQSVVSLAYLNGKLYGGTSIRGGYGVDKTPKATKAVFFSYDPLTGTRTDIALNTTATLTAITALAVVDNKIWGMAEGQLFVYDPALPGFTRNPTNLFPAVDYTWGTWEDAKLATTPSDTSNVYGVIGDTFFKINKTGTPVVTVLKDTGADHLTVDAYGNMYYSDNHRLYRWIP